MMFLIISGPRFVVQIGEKLIDYNEEFRLFMCTRNPAPEIPPDAMSVLTEINFTTTRAGLSGQVSSLCVLFSDWLPDPLYRSVFFLFSSLIGCVTGFHSVL